MLDGARRGRWRGAMKAVAGAYALNTAIKPVVRRRRPSLPDLPPLTGTPTGLSFPSAHASTSFAGALAYSRLGLPPAPLYALAASLALSRLYLGVHHPSDVLAGALLGTVVVSRLGA
jgi:membrane-associated phospholipid phosphatase